MIRPFLHPIIDYRVWKIVIFTRSHFSLCCRHTLKRLSWGDCTILLWRNFAKTHETDHSNQKTLLDLLLPGNLLFLRPYWPTSPLIANNASVNSKHQHPPGQPPGIFPNFQPGSRDLYHLNFPGVPRGSNLLHNVKVPSCQLIPDEGTFQLQTDVPSLCCSLVTKSVWKLGENFKTLSMVLKLKQKDMTWTAFQFFLRYDFCKIPKFRRRPTGKAD